MAITFVNPAEEYHFEKIEEIIRMEVPTVQIPDQVEIPKTPFEEMQDYEKEIDNQKKKENPDFKGAFHEKKIKHRPNPNEKKEKRGNKNSKAKRNRNQMKSQGKWKNK